MLMITPEFSQQLRAGLARSVRGSEIRRLVRAGLANSTGRSPVTLAGSRKPTKRRLSRERYDRLFDNVVTILNTRAWSKFEFEGPCLNGLRSGLCLEGWRWDEAHACAAEIVARALDRIGAVRPVWSEGQPEYTYDGLIDRSRCARCGGAIPEERFRFSPARTKYCSDICRDAAGSERRRRSGERMTMVEWLAACSVKSQRTLEDLTRDCAHCGAVFIAHDHDGKCCSRACSKAHRTKRRKPRVCLHCGKMWQPDRASDRSLGYCSPTCSAAARVIHEPRACEQCGTEFKPSGEQKYCSLECKGLASRKARTEATCEWCSSVFPLTRKEQRFCSNSCSAKARNAVRIKPRDVRICRGCSTTFRPEFPSSQRQFCSVKCSSSFTGAQRRTRFICDDAGGAA